MALDLFKGCLLSLHGGLVPHVPLGDNGLGVVTTHHQAVRHLLADRPLGLEIPGREGSFSPPSHPSIIIIQRPRTQGPVTRKGRKMWTKPYLED